MTDESKVKEELATMEAQLYELRMMRVRGERAEHPPVSVTEIAIDMYENVLSMTGLDKTNLPPEFSYALVRTISTSFALGNRLAEIGILEPDMEKCDCFDEINAEIAEIDTDLAKLLRDYHNE